MATKNDESDGNSKWSRRQVLLTPGRRPLNYRGSEGWASRIVSTTLVAGALGAGSGLLIGTARGQPTVRFAATLGANFALAACCFCGARELVRELRAADSDDWINGMLGGLASGSVLGYLQGGQKKVLPIALQFAGIGIAVQLAATEFQEYRLRHFLAAHSHETVPGDPASLLQGEQPQGSNESEQKKSKWYDWLPIKMFDEEEAARRALDKQQRQQEIIQSLHSGEFTSKNQRP